MISEEELEFIKNSKTETHTRIKEMAAELLQRREKVEKLENILWKITEWTKAYPLEAWPEPTKSEWEKARAILEQHEINMDKFNVSNLRHVINGIAKIITEADHA
jgi:hypothetical protein